jgi:biotin-(acetyl-CoA carboxylase) ligase
MAYKDQEVDLVINGNIQTATVIGLAADGGLRAQLVEGEQRVFYTGEIQLRPHAK